MGDTSWKRYTYLNEMTDEAEFHLDKTTDMLMQAQDGISCRDIAIESKPAYDIFVLGGGFRASSPRRPRRTELEAGDRR